MRRNSYLAALLFSLVGITSCTLLERNKQRIDSRDSMAQSVVEKEWINANYHRTLSQTHSPALAQNSCYYTFITIANDTASFILNFHEGDAAPLVAVGEAHYRIYNSWNEADSLDLYYRNDTLFLEGDEVNEQFLDFNTISSSSSIQGYVAQKSIAGHYSSEDGSKQILFGPERLITGFEPYLYYDVAIDLIALSDAIDVVTLTNEQGEKSDFAWSREGNRLHLYAIPTELSDEIITQELLKQCKLHYLFVSH